MATINFATNVSTGGPSTVTYAGAPYLVETQIDLATAVTQKGSALALADVIQAINVPANTVVLFAGVGVINAVTAANTDFTVDVGITGADVDNFVDGYDLDAASNGGVATAVGVNEPVVLASADTIDVRVATGTGSLTAGKIRVFALMADVSKRTVPGLAQIGS